MIDVLFAHSVARRENKPPFFFSRFNFERMKELGNTHYCCACLCRAGFSVGEDGQPTNMSEEDTEYFQKHHDATHAPYTVANADKYDNPWRWFETEIKTDFPYLVTIPSLN